MLSGDWVLEQNTVKFLFQNREYFWEMPEDYEMPSKALLDLAEFLLLQPYGKVAESQASRKFGSRVGVAYSGGVDSTAAMNLLPDPIAVYTQIVKPSAIHKMDNALAALKERDGLAIKSNYDELPKQYKRSPGFYGAGGFTITLVLLADYLDLHTVADGNVLETVYLFSAHGHGTKYTPRDFSSVLERFEKAGLYYSMPCAGLTEVSTTLIAGESDYVMGCMRGDLGTPCNYCAKCYRKSALAGHPIATCPEAEKKINKEYVSMLPSLLWAVERCGLEHPKLSPLKKDISWVDKWYADSIKYVPGKLREFFTKRLEDFGIESLHGVSPLQEWESR
ncbi:hypothetical protein SAMN04487965_0011 [Microbulbifer donghaiensis]|uniref:7-cyano-7-deazaguanine synthase (Queuosine biosynthesis) n=1 Tax=Microbulbifer donghaiensis TaxID=494016 RepID=A0A1M4TYM6_9GAMM|nr:DUF6395 domain-containing protein [Microbulbifer donghaiensis]SHE49464.1 hypothetical protein SAMN04487965_0011 [Microbulbifer donghaiensis]